MPLSQTHFKIVMEIEQIFRKKADYYDNCLIAFNGFRAGAYSTELPLLEWVADFSIFTLMGAFDLWIVHCDYLRSVKAFQRNYYTRQSALLLFELLNGIPEYFSKEKTLYFTVLFEEKLLDKSIFNNMKSIRKDIGWMKQKEQQSLKEIRNLVAAHREKDLNKSFKVLNQINEDKIQVLSLSLLKKIDLLHTEMNKCISYIHQDGESKGKELFLSYYSLT